ncbi:TIGR03943 family protein [Microbacterium sp. LRZ72]|uniref:TIGR03943 family putative permease subunit n=1 Tax=Microbacterium sp. LRZ72 TaxID=2942481 RepID=UPI0029A94877|nr:TIGR03943 family protein [Microbacterium sp. LRZ72]MDX2376135.1 TIGR03943 family protein [Microbacterium sp. LRZ72]
MTRWLGVGLAAAIAVVTVGLWATGRLGLYINPDSAWWYVSMSLVLLVGAVLSCTVRIDHDDHHHDDDVPVDTAPTVASRPRFRLAGPAAVIAGGVSSVLVVSAILLPPASLSPELALARASGAPPVLSTSATLALAASEDTSQFGVGEWSQAIATTTDPARFVGEGATLTGFVAPGADGFLLTRLVIVHCVIDAQAASVPVAETSSTAALDEGQWVEVEGRFTRADGGELVLTAESITPVDEPEDPYEY